MASECHRNYTRESSLRNMTWSKPSNSQKSVELRGFSIGLGSNGLSFAGPSFTANFEIAKDSQNRFMNIGEDLDTRLKTSIVKPVLLYDTSSRVGWLIPTTCVLLLMIHLRARELNRYPSKRDGSDNMLFARCEEEAGREAYDVLRKYVDSNLDGSLGASETWQQIIARLFIALEMALNESLSTK